MIKYIQKIINEIVEKSYTKNTVTSKKIKINKNIIITVVQKKDVNNYNFEIYEISIHHKLKKNFILFNIFGEKYAPSFKIFVFQLNNNKCYLINKDKNLTVYGLYDDMFDENEANKIKTIMHEGSEKLKLKKIVNHCYDFSNIQKKDQYKSLILYNNDLLIQLNMYDDSINYQYHTANFPIKINIDIVWKNVVIETNIKFAYKFLKSMNDKLADQMAEMILLYHIPIKYIACNESIKDKFNLYLPKNKINLICSPLKVNENWKAYHKFIYSDSISTSNISIVPLNNKVFTKDMIFNYKLLALQNVFNNDKDHTIFVRKDDIDSMDFNDGIVSYNINSKKILSTYVKIDNELLLSTRCRGMKLNDIVRKINKRAELILEFK